MKGENETKGNAAKSFEDLHIYQRARELTNAIYSLTRSGTFARDRSLSDQIRRASVSIMSNVAEGFERGTRAEFVQFLYIAKGSCGEVRAQLQIALDQAYITPDTHASLVDVARRLAGMISNFIAHLQQSSYRGEKFARPQRQAQEQVAKWMEAGRAAQLKNIRAQQQRHQLPPDLHSENSDPAPTSGSAPSHPSNSSHPSPCPPA
jgi:four helix bundle protein